MKQPSLLLAIVYLVAATYVSTSPVLVDESSAAPIYLEWTNNSRSDNLSTTGRTRRQAIDSHPHRHHQCRPDPRSAQLQRRSLCPFAIQRDTNPQRIPDVILRAQCLCESSTCSHPSTSSHHQQQSHLARCVSLVSPLKVAYLDPQLKFVVSTEVVHVPVACICASQPPGRHMPQQHNIVV